MVRGKKRMELKVILHRPKRQHRIRTQVLTFSPGPRKIKLNRITVLLSLTKSETFLYHVGSILLIVCISEDLSLEGIPRK